MSSITMTTSETSETKNLTVRSAVITWWAVSTPPIFDEICDKIKYIAWGKEIAPTTGREHLQMFAYAHKPMRYTQWEKIFKPYMTVHWNFEQMRGSFQSNQKYCSKEGKLEEYGERPFQGMRRDLLSLKRKLDEGIKPLDLAEDDEYFGVVAKHHRFAETYSDHRKGKVLKMCREAPNVYLLKGEPGSGKTSWCDNKFGVGNWVKLPSPTNNTWWFTRECCTSDTIVIDDVGPTKVPEIETLLEWLDRYAFQAPIKGGNQWCKPKNWVLTTNVEPATWWEKAKGIHIDALERRISERIDI